MKTSKTLAWYEWTLFAIVVLIALAMSWYSVFDLTTVYWDVPQWLGVVVSTVFDIGALFLGLMAIRYARTQDSGFWIELWAFGFILVSIVANVQHALIANFGPVGAILFGAAPVAAAVLLKIVLNYLNRQAKREAGRIVEKLPSVGWFAWLRYRKQTWRLMSVAVQKRLIDAADRLDMSEDRHKIFGDSAGVLQATVQSPQVIVETPERIDKELVQTPVKKQEQLSGTVSKKELTSPDAVSLPVWLPHEPTMSLATLVRTCLDNGVLDLETMFRYAKDIKGQEVNKMSLAKTLSRQKAKDT